MPWDGVCFGTWRSCQENKNPFPRVAFENAVPVTGVMHTVCALAFPFSPSPPPPPPPRNTQRQVGTQNYQSRRMRRLISKREKGLFDRLRSHVFAFLTSPTAGPLCHYAVNIYQWPSEVRQWSPADSTRRHLSDSKCLRGKGMN